MSEYNPGRRIAELRRSSAAGLHISNPTRREQDLTEIEDGLEDLRQEQEENQLTQED